MSWSRTHRYWDAVHEATEEIEHHPEQGLPWNPHLAEVFGTRRALLDALRYRWNVLVQAQDDSLVAELEERHASMLRVIAAAAAAPSVADSPAGLGAHLAELPSRPVHPVHRAIA